MYARLMSKTRDGYIYYIHIQCSKLSFYPVHSSGAEVYKLCTRGFSYALLLYIAMINGLKKTCAHRAHMSEKRAPGLGNVRTGRRVHC